MPNVYLKGKCKTNVWNGPVPDSLSLPECPECDGVDEHDPECPLGRRLTHFATLSRFTSQSTRATIPP